MRLTRRRLLIGGASVIAAGVVVPEWANTLPGATAPPADPTHVLLRAYVSTLVPGPGDDPHGTPGAVEAGAVEQLEVQVPYIIPLIVADLTAGALVTAGTDFASLPYAEREAILVEAFAHPVRAPYHLIALAIGAGTFYGDFRNHVGGEHLGFPGPSAGYLDTFTDRTGHGQPDGPAVPP